VSCWALRVFCGRRIHICPGDGERRESRRERARAALRGRGATGFGAPRDLAGSIGAGRGRRSGGLRGRLLRRSRSEKNDRKGVLRAELLKIVSEVGFTVKGACECSLPPWHLRRNAPEDAHRFWGGDPSLPEGKRPERIPEGLASKDRGSGRGALGAAEAAGGAGAAGASFGFPWPSGQDDILGQNGSERTRSHALRPASRPRSARASGSRRLENAQIRLRPSLRLACVLDDKMACVAGTLARTPARLGT